MWWPILLIEFEWIFALHLTHPRCTHTQQWTHTHTGAVGSHLWCGARGWGFGALLKGTSFVVLRVERALVIHSPHLQFLLARDSNLQPFDLIQLSDIRPLTSQVSQYLLLTVQMQSFAQYVVCVCVCVRAHVRERERVTLHYRSVQRVLIAVCLQTHTSIITVSVMRLF